MNPTFEFNPLNVLRLLRSAGGALLAQSALHAELASIEWAEEKLRLARIATAAMLAVLGASCFLLLSGVVVIAIYWQSAYQIAVTAGVLLFYAVIAVAGVISLKRQIALGALTFAATREEIAADLAMLKAKL